MNESLIAFLATHLGLVTRRECATMGITPRQIAGMVDRGELIRVHAGIYRHAAVPVTTEQRLYAGLLAAGARSRVSHRSAIAYHGVRNFGCDLVELATTATSPPRRRGLLVHRTTRLDARDVVRRGLLTITRPARSLLDASTVMSPALVARFAQEWMANKVIRAGDIDGAIERHPARRSLGEFIDLLHDADIGDADSVPEAELGEILTRAGMPPVLHHLVTTLEGNTYELDWSYPDEMVGLELDGYGVHLRSARAFDDDRLRRNELENNGWRIRNFTRRICRNRPWRVVEQVRRALSLSRTAQ